MKTMMKTISISFLCLFGISVLSLSAQSKFHVLVDYHYAIGLNEKKEGGIFKDDMYGHLLHLTALYAVTEKHSIGIGAGLDRYESPGYNTLPIFATLHYSPWRHTPSVYLYTDAGYALDSGDFIPGYLISAGFGCKKMFKEHFGLNFRCGFDLKQFKGTAFHNPDLASGQIGQYIDVTQTQSFFNVGVGIAF